MGPSIDNIAEEYEDMIRAWIPREDGVYGIEISVNIADIDNRSIVRKANEASSV